MEKYGTYQLAAKTCQISPTLLWVLRQQHPQLDADLTEAKERYILNLGDLAQCVLAAHLQAQLDGDRPYHQQSVELALRRADPKWARQAATPTDEEQGGDPQLVRQIVEALNG